MAGYNSKTIVFCTPDTLNTSAFGVHAEDRAIIEGQI